MAHFAQIDTNNVVIRVLVVPDEQETRGQEFLANDLLLDGKWIQTSYNTWGGKHRLGGIPFRKNYAKIGSTYDPIRDAFIPPKPYNSWLLDEQTCLWNPPIPHPQDGMYVWDESSLSWLKDEKNNNFKNL
jgi:hypothetical protein